MNRYFINVITNPSFHYEDNQNLSYFLKKEHCFLKYSLQTLDAGLLCHFSMETNLSLTQFSLLCTMVPHQGVITAHLSWKATGAPDVYFLYLFFFFFFKGLPLLLSCKYQRESPAQRHISGRDGFSPDLAPVQACVSEQWGRQWLVVSSTTKQQNH